MEMPYKIEVLWCRIFQGVLKIGNYFMGYRMPKFLEGPGKIKDEDIDRMITWTKKEANPLYPVPVVWARKDFRGLIESIRK